MRRRRAWIIAVMLAGSVVASASRAATPAPVSATPVSTPPAAPAAIIHESVTLTAEELEQLLSPERWREYAYGLSLRPPRDMQLHPMSARGGLLKMTGLQNQTITLALKKSKNETDIAAVQTEALQQLEFLNPSGVILEQRDFKLKVREDVTLPAAIIYFLIRNTQDPPWIMAQAFLQLDPVSLAMLQMEVDQGLLPAAKPAFEALLQSLRVEDPKQLDKEREQWVAAGTALLAPLQIQTLQTFLKPERFLRIVENGKDVGWRRIAQTRETLMGLPGVQIEIQSQVQRDHSVEAVWTHYFLSDDMEREIWSVRQALSRRGAPTAPTAGGKPVDPPPRFAWAESGLREREQITISLEMPSNFQKLVYQRPAKGYLPQVVAQLLPYLLLESKAQTLGFYCYLTRASKLALRSVEVVPLPAGGFELRTRPSPDMAQEIARYDARGELMRRELPDGVEEIATTAGQLRQIWNVR